MHDENQQFFDGILLGAFVVGLIVVTIVTYMLLRQAPTVGEYQSEPREEPEILNTLPETESLTTSVDEIGESVTIDGESYLISQSLQKDDLVFRLLVLDTEENQSYIDKYASETEGWDYLGCFNGDTIYGSREFQQPIFFSVWDKEGERLVNLDKEITEKVPYAPNGCVKVEKWFNNGTEDLLVLSSFLGDAGTAAAHAYLYSYENEDLTEGLSFIQRASPRSFGVNSDTYSYIDVWYAQNRALAQLTTYTNDGEFVSASDIHVFNQFFDEGVFGDDVESIILGSPIAYETDQALDVKILNDANLRNFSAGVYFSSTEGLFPVTWKNTN